jgi:hypothetical protein
MMTQSADRLMLAAGQWLAIMARTRWLPGSTSIATIATPRASAAEISARTRADPTP